VDLFDSSDGGCGEEGVGEGRCGMEGLTKAIY
jgi:hypothetical protein